jgi:hypothetical protein
MQSAVVFAPARFCVAGIPLRIFSDDAAFVEEFRLLFGGADEALDSERPALDVHLSSEHRTLRIDDNLNDPAAFLESFNSPTIPITRAPSWSQERPLLAIGQGMTLDFDGPTIKFQPVGRWRRVLAHLTFLRLLRQRPDALFLHAASVSIAGKGVLLIGPKGSGKTTLSAALAARSHPLLGDETAMCIASSGLLLPFRRPLSIKPGPAAAEVQRVIATRAGGVADEDGVLHLDIREISPVIAAPAPLRAMVFLRGFAPTATLKKVDSPGAEHAALLQPLGASLSAVSAPGRVFAMFRMLATSSVFDLCPAGPDRTAQLIEEVIEGL